MTAQPEDQQTLEAQQYWGYLFKENKCGADKLNSLLSGIWGFIGTNFEPGDSKDITPSQIAAYYRAVGGDYDCLFSEANSTSIAFIYKSLGCLHSLQPSSDEETYSSPYIPALKRKGFITWQTIQLLLCPEEHVPFIQEAVRIFDIKDLQTGEAFPRILPKEAFPDRPDADMVRWYESVSERLRQDALAGELEASHIDDANRSSSDISREDERHQAAAYFRNPAYRNHEGRAGIVRGYSRNPSQSPRAIIAERGRAVANTVRHFWSPQDRRRSAPDRYPDQDDDDDRTPTALPSRHVAPVRSRARRESTESLSSTDPESERDQRARRPGPLHHRRSHEPPTSPREYFPHHNGDNTRYSPALSEPRRPPDPQTGFIPADSPLFATRVAQMGQPAYYYERNERRPSLQRNGSYGRPSVRYSVSEAVPVQVPHYATVPPIRSNDDRYESRSRDRSRSGSHRYVTPMNGVGGRRYPADTGWR